MDRPGLPSLGFKACQHLAEDRPHDLVLVGEVLIQGRGPQPAGSDNFGHVDPLDAALVEQALGRVENPAALTLPMGVVGVRG